MKFLIKSFSFILLFSGLFMSCSSDECETICETGQILDINCNCVSLQPCDGIICEEGEILTADCDCVDSSSGQAQEVTVTGFVSNDALWTNDRIYILSGKVVVAEGATLTIEPGTLIKAEQATGSLASALVVARGGKLIAEGTAESPIIFTSVTDDIQIGQILSPNLDEFENQLWGGLVILGRAPVSVGEGDSEGLVEGFVAGEGIGEYGGNDPNDNSGILKYISVRHGGISVAPDKEINGITFGGVGAGTVVENIEVVANLDDGIEWFGGTVNCKNVVVAYGEDDGLDIDQNYAGTITNAVVIQSGATAGDNAIEIDGPEGSLTDGFFTIENITLIDKDGLADTAGDLKSKTQGQIINASWRGYGDNIKLRQSCESDCSTTKEDSYSNYIDGKIRIINSEWIGTGSVNDMIEVYGDKDCENDEACQITEAMQAQIGTLLSDDGNTVTDVATKGADLSAFNGWSWVARSGNL